MSLFDEEDIPRCPEHGKLLPCFRCAEEGDRVGRELGGIRKVEKMAQVQSTEDEDLQAAKDEWMARHLVAARRMCVELRDFTGEMIFTRGYIEKPPGDHRLAGPANARLAGLGWAVKTNMTRPSTDPSSNKQPREVWVSLLFEGKAWAVETCPTCAGLGSSVKELVR